MRFDRACHCYPSVANETVAFEVLEKVAVSEGRLGTVGGDQLSAVFQSLVAGCESQVALPAWTSKAEVSVIVTRMSSLVFMGFYRLGSCHWIQSYGKAVNVRSSRLSQHS